MHVSDLRETVIACVRRGVTHTPEPIQLASGAWSSDFIDAKAALSRGQDLAAACRAMIERAGDLGIEFDAVGGLTLGADQFAHGIAILGDVQWFVVRKAAKGRGTNKRVEGVALHEGMRVLLVDDVVTSGGSIQQAHEEIEKTGATTTGALTLVDRGETAVTYFAAAGIPYGSLVTYRDLDIPPIPASSALEAPSVR
ncbi:MAG: phosphoribosyltransferase family protein [Acidimicrobiales bacterium]